MFQQFENAQKLNKDGVDAALKSFGTVSKGVQNLSTQVFDYSKSSMENASSAIKRLSEVKSPAGFLEVQSDYLKSYYNALIAQSAKIREIYTSTAKEAFKPFEHSFAARSPFSPQDVARANAA